MLMITGARSWEHEQWQNTYYPDEIAADWHLTFYAKEFQTALAPVALWSQYNIEEIKEFCTDVSTDYPLLFEQADANTRENSHVQTLQQSMDDFVANWVVFQNDGWQKNEESYQIKQAEIIRNSNLEKNSAVFYVYSTEVLSDTVLQEIMLTIKKERSQYDVVYCYFDGELASINVLNTLKTLRKMLALD